MRTLLIIIICVLLSGCAMAPLQITAIRQNPYELQTKSKSISVTKLVDALELRKVIGKAYGGTACVSHGDLYWTGNEKVLTDVSNTVRKKLDKLGYSLIGKAHSPFNDEFSKQSELLLGGKIADVKANTCSSIMGGKGEVFVKIDWEVYNTKEKNIVLTVSSEGYSSRTEFEKDGTLVLYTDAFDMAIDNLLAEKAFYNLLVGGQ